MGPCDWGTTPDQREFSRNRFWTRTSSTKFSAYAGVLRLTADNDERQRTAVQQTAFLRKEGDHALYHHQACFGHAALRYEQAVRDQAQAAIERATSLHQSEMTLHRLENIVDKKGQTISFTQMDRVAESSMSEQRASLIVDGGYTGTPSA